ncbi:mannosyl-3-phosphoglycerate phosphatase [archaeon]|nr:mannosyl-3-phosphoglycerate phosphatase [archaeon]
MVLENANTTNKQPIIFTDLDGTLLDHKTYSFKSAIKTLNIIKNRKIPIVFCTSKTRAEIEKYRTILDIKDPFISENGGAIYIPKDYFDFDYSFDKKLKNYNVVELGTQIKEILKVIILLKEKGYDIKTFSEMTEKEVSKDCGLNILDARLAKLREYDEVFTIVKKEQEKNIIKTIKNNGYNVTSGGRYHHVMGNNDKGKAVKILTGLFKIKYKKIKTIGLGDGNNDLPMLKTVNCAVIVKNSAHNTLKVSFDVLRTKKEGSAGWSDAINKII